MDSKSFQNFKNSSEIDVCPRTNRLQLDSVSEERLNEIDEFIQSKLGFPPLSDLNAGNPLTATEVNELRCFSPTGERLNESLSWNNPENLESRWMTHPESPNKVSEVEVEVQIMDLKDVYDKKTKKTLEGFEYRLKDSKVTVVVQASDEINSFQAYTQRCHEAAVRTHDTIGPVELKVNTLESDARRRVVSIDLGSVYKTEDGDPVYWLEKAEVMQRNKWELIIAMTFSSGLTGNVTSRPFRVTTKASCKNTRKGGSVDGSCKVQRIFHKITGSYNSVTDHDCRRQTFLPNSGHKKELPQDASALSQELKEFSLMMERDSAFHTPPAENTGSVSPVEERIFLQSNTILDRHTVATYYSRDQRIHRVVEQPELTGLLKLVSKQSQPVNTRRKGHRFPGEDFWWACGHCFFKRRKKSTIKDHLIQRVCLKSTEDKKYKARVERRQLKRNLSFDLETEHFENYLWKNSLSV